MPRSVFVSYSHQQGEWVWDRLVPVLRAAGVEFFYDRKDFEAARALDQQMDEWQDRADSTLLILSPEYLASPACQREMARAIAKDPAFTTRPASAVPVLKETCTLPASILTSNPLYLDFRDDGHREPWAKLFRFCEGSLAPSPPAWLTARDECHGFLSSRQSVNLEVGANVAWRALLKHFKDLSFPALGIVDLHRGAVASRQGFVKEILRSIGITVPVPDKPQDLGVLEANIATKRKTLVALTHFDAVATPGRLNEYDYDLFMTLRDLVTERRLLTLLVVSRAPAVSLFPRDHPFSNLDLKTVILRGEA